MAYWLPLKLKEISIGGFKGLHEAVSPANRPLGALSVASNVVTDDPNALETRPGITAVTGGAVAAAQIKGLHRYINMAGITDRVLAQAGTILKYWNAGWTTINAGTVASVTVTAGGSGYGSPPTVTFSGGGGSGAAGTAVLAAGAVDSVTLTAAGTGYYAAPTISFSGGGGTGAAATAVMTVPDEMFTAANLNDTACLFYAGNTAPKSYNGTTYAALSGSPPNGAYVTEAHDQLFVGGISGREGDLDFCDVGDPTTWTPAATNDAGSITVSQSNITWVDYDKSRDKVLIWTEQEFMMLIGPETPNRPNLWTVQTIAQVGCPAGRSVVNMDGVWVWLTADSHRRGFAFWRGGDVEVVTEPFRTTMDNRFPRADDASIGISSLKWAAVKQAVAWLDQRNRYYCTFNTASTTVQFIYDPKTRLWTVGTGTLFYAASKALFYGRHIYLVGDGSGNVFEVRGTSDNGTAITYTVEVGPTQYGDPFKASQIVGAVVVVSLQSGATMTASFAPGESAAYGTGVALTVNPGTIASVTITAGGSGYTSAPTVAFSGGGGSGAAGTAVLTGDAVTSVTITNAGTGYTSAPTVAFSGGGGSGATGTAVTTVNAAMTQVRISVPVNTSDTQRAGVWRMKLTGSGVVEIHDILLRVYESGRVI